MPRNQALKLKRLWGCLLGGPSFNEDRAMQRRSPSPAVPLSAGVWLRCLSVLLFVALAPGATLAFGQSAAKVRDGDIIFHTSRSAQSQAVQRATGSRYSHMGIILFQSSEPRVFEAISTVRFTPLEEWRARGEGGHYVIKRLRDADVHLTPAALLSLRHAASVFEGRPYDSLFGWGDEKLYCSELVWKLYANAVNVRLTEPRKVRDFNLSDPVVQQKARERYGTRGLPLEEPAVAPVDIFESSLLITVTEQ